MPATDIALLQIKADKLKALPFGESDALRVGDYVLAIGNPFGLGQTVTSGIVSALGRTGMNVEGYEDFIQTDAAINPGNSGGALTNLRGELIGINSAIFGPGGGSVGIGFAVPSGMARAVMAQLIKYGEMRRGRFGATSQDLTPDLAQALGLSMTEGVVIVEVASGGPAERAGSAPRGCRHACQRPRGQELGRPAQSDRADDPRRHGGAAGASRRAAPHHPRAHRGLSPAEARSSRVRRWRREAGGGSVERGAWCAGSASSRDRRPGTAVRTAPRDMETGYAVRSSGWHVPGTPHSHSGNPESLAHFLDCCLRG